jgi:mannosyltransferase OCH1-like enzyme
MLRAREACTCGQMSACAPDSRSDGECNRNKLVFDLRRVSRWQNAPTKRLPKIMHQSWKRCDLEALQTSWRESCQRLNPDWEFRLWSDEDLRELIATHYSSFLDVYDGYQRNISRVDSARLFILHRFGGVFMDLDFACLRPFAELEQPPGSAIFSFQYADHLKDKLPGQVANNFMGAPPRHPFFEFAIKHLRGARTAYPPELKATGPDFVTVQLRAYDHLTRYQTPSLHKFDNRAAIKNGTWSNVTVFSQPTLYANAWNRPKHWCGTGLPEDLDQCRRTSRSIVTTFWTRTWKPVPHWPTNKTAGSVA